MTESVLDTSSKPVAGNFSDNLLGTLVAPVSTFRRLALECRSEINQLPGALAILSLVYAADALRLTPANQLNWALINVPAEVTAGLVLWLLSAAVINLTALCFGADISKARASFVTLAWSFLPWIFLGPLACFWKVLGPAHGLLMSLPLLWILVLQILAVKESFQMKAWQAIILFLLIPPLFSILQFMQFLQGLTATLSSIIS